MKNISTPDNQEIKEMMETVNLISCYGNSHFLKAWFPDSHCVEHL